MLPLCGTRDTASSASERINRAEVKDDCTRTRRLHKYEAIEEVEVRKPFPLYVGLTCQQRDVGMVVLVIETDVCAYL